MALYFARRVGRQGGGVGCLRVVSARVRARAALTALEQPSDAAIEEFAGETFDHYDEHAAELRAFAGG